MFIGGIHGDEPATVALLKRFGQSELKQSPNPVLLLTLANPDGADRRTRYNARGVDLNRNFPTNWTAHSEEPPGPAPWSEPESRLLRDLFMWFRPATIVSLLWALAEIDADGAHSTSLSRCMWEALSEEERRPYRIRIVESDTPRAGDVCPGSLGQWCGYSVVYPDGTRPAMVTLELPYDPAAQERPSPLPLDHLATVKQAWKRDAEGYLAAVEPGVRKMLQAAVRHG